MLSSQTAALAFFGRVQSGVARLHTSVHQQLSYQLDAVSLTAAAALSGGSGAIKSSRDVVVSTNGATLQSLFVCASASPSSAHRDTTDALVPTDSADMLITSSSNDTRSEGSDLLLTALDGVSLHIAGFLDAQELYHVQLVNRSWRAFVIANREALFGALLLRSFESVVPASSPFASYMLSLRRELTLELRHTEAVKPTHAALETYCSSTEPSDHGFIAMFCDIVEFTDPRVARFVSSRRHHALSVVLAATADHVNAFRKRSGYTRPVAFVPVCNPNWPEFELPHVEFPGFLGYAFDFVRMAPGYEPLKDTVVKSILRDLMVFDSSEHAATYGTALGRPPFAAILDDALLNDELHMRFSSPLRRKLSALPIAARIRSLQTRICAIDTCLINAQV